jgi:hypothetical protein
MKEGRNKRMNKGKDTIVNCNVSVRQGIKKPDG